LSGGIVKGIITCDPDIQDASRWSASISTTCPNASISLGSIIASGTCEYPPLWNVLFDKGDCECQDILYRCEVSDINCSGSIQSLDTLAPLNYCASYYDGALCSVLDADTQYTTSPEQQYVIICCGDMAVRFAFSQEFLNSEGLGRYNGSGPYDCIKLMTHFSPTEDGDYCDRVHLELWNSIPNPSNPYDL
jgi:hypothetical protein